MLYMLYVKEINLILRKVKFVLDAETGHIVMIVPPYFAWSVV